MTEQEMSRALEKAHDHLAMIDTILRCYYNAKSGNVIRRDDALRIVRLMNRAHGRLRAVEREVPDLFEEVEELRQVWEKHYNPATPTPVRP